MRLDVAQGGKKVAKKWQKWVQGGLQAEHGKESDVDASFKVGGSGHGTTEGGETRVA